jgi:DNA repair protein RecN (Recombination protein N)
MLAELRIRNYALIERLSFALGPGLNVLTGETGAGKSIVVGALSVLLGERATSDVVRSGEERASIEGVFEVDGRADVLRILDERGIEAEEGGLLVLRREVAREGRNRAWVNGSPTTAGVLGELGRALVDLHGQHEHQTLLRRDEQREILDAFGGHAALLEGVADAHRQVVSSRERLAALEARRREAEARVDLLRFQAGEIEGAALHAGEEEEIADEERRLAHAEELQSLAGTLAEGIGGSERSLAASLAGLRRTLDALVRIDPSEAGALELHDTAYYALRELGDRMERYAAGIEHDPRRLEELRRRGDLLYRLRAKYGTSLEDVIEAGRRARAELDLLDGAGWEIGELTAALGVAEDALRDAGAALGSARREAARRLVEEVRSVLPGLGMRDGVFEVALLPRAEVGSTGGEEVEFRIALNRGFEPRPLATVASGGELSRIMLALKTVLARVDAVPTLIFDEVDAGIGGRVALQVGETLRRVAGDHQVLAITHLPQIASRAHVHLSVTKEERDGRSATAVHALEPGERVREIARMLGGDPESAVSLDHARELLERGGAAPPAG